MTAAMTAVLDANPITETVGGVVGGELAAVGGHPPGAGYPLSAVDRSVVVRRSRAVRWPVAAVGVVCVGLGAVGVVVPGMPTTVFLIVACWCFARSCPWLEAKLVRVPLFGPFVRYLGPGVVMPVRAKAWSIGVMWASVGISGVWMVMAGVPWAAMVGTCALAAVGTWFIVRHGCRRESR